MRSKDGVCPFPAPTLDPASAIAFYLFHGCRTQWQRSEMSGQRIGIPYDRMKVRAEVFGIELNELLLEKFDACVDEIVSADNERTEVKES